MNLTYINTWVSTNFIVSVTWELGHIFGKVIFKTQNREFERQKMRMSVKKPQKPLISSFSLLFVVYIYLSSSFSPRASAISESGPFPVSWCHYFRGEISSGYICTYIGGCALTIYRVRVIIIIVRWYILFVEGFIRIYICRRQRCLGGNRPCSCWWWA